MQDKDAIIESLLKRIEGLQQQSLATIERELQKDKLIEEQAAIILQLQEQIARLEKNSTTSSKPPSSDITNPPLPKGKKKKRKHGGQKGHKKHTRHPFLADEIDETIIHKLPDAEVVRRGLTELPQTEMAVQQVSLPTKLYCVTEHRVQLYRDKNGNEVKAILPPEVRKCGLFAPDMMAAAAYFKGMCHGSYSTVQSIFAEIFNLKVCTGFLTGICVDKVSKSMAHGYDEVAEHIKNAPVVGSDETGHSNPAFKSAWTWCWQTPSAALFFNTNSRGSDVLKKILGEDFAGIIVCDFFSANKKFINDLGLKAQFCFAHLIRDIKFLTTLPLKNVVQWADELLKILRKIFEKCKYRHSGDSKYYQKIIAKLKKVFLQKVRRPPSHTDAMNIKDRFDKIGAERYFLFLERDDVPPTNNGTEQSIRFVVIDRKVTQGTRSDAGMRFCERMWTVVATSRKQGKSVFEFLKAAVASTFTGTPYPQLIA